MNTKITAKSKLLILVLLGFSALAGCDHGYYSAGVVIGPPPPPPVYGPIGYAPGPDFVWTTGYYDLVGGRWFWRNGSWRRHPRGRTRWVAPHWDREGRGWHYHKGYWQR